ncbi:MAG: IS5 family transposase [Oscillibacter sp.]|nr:IS5 family transposase [Oscillibacter sp.]
MAFRKRFSEEDLAAILEASVPKVEAEGKDDSDDGNDPPNSGTLILDATCCPADIAYPQDIDLLNQAREKAEKTVDELCEMTGQKKPRMYRRRARKDYLRLSKSKKRSAKAIRSAVRKQLQYIRRDIGYIAEMVQKGAKLSSKQAERLNIVTTVYEQQRIMFESGTHSIPRRIVSLAQPWVRPIVRGKAHANTEFGPKLHISLVDGYARIERLDFEPFNESEDLWRAVLRYRERYGCYPERILADKIYRNRQTLAFCKEHGIRLSGPALGKPPKNQILSRQAKKLEYQDNCDRNAVEGIFGTGKTAYGLARISAHLQETAVCVIGVALLLLNLSRSMRSLPALFCLLAVLTFLQGLRSRAYL